MGTSLQNALQPFLEGSGPNEEGEWGLHCPLPDHEDEKRSASVNFKKGVWFCHACEVGGRIEELVPVIQELRKKRSGNGSSQKIPEISTGMVEGWASALQSNEERLTEFLSRRGLTNEIVQEFKIGWDSRTSSYTIPIQDEEGRWVNIRRYQLDPKDERRKIWSVRGHGEPRLFPTKSLEFETIIVCEGELDALITIQNGFNAITRTGAAKVWKNEWNVLFKGKTVFVCHDMDVAGQQGNVKVAESLSGIARSVHIVELPYQIEKKHGKDLTDFWRDGYSGDDLLELLEDSELEPYVPTGVTEEPEEEFDPEVIDVSVIDSFSSDHFGDALRMRVTVTGKRNPPYLLPKTVNYSCGQEAGVKCVICPMNQSGYNGEHTSEIDPGDPSLLEMMGATNDQLTGILRKRIAAQKCNFLRISPTEHFSAERLFVRPEVDVSRMSYEAGDYQPRSIVCVGKHDTLPNNTVQLTGAIWPHPRDQSNEFLSWDIRNVETSIDKFEMSPRKFEELSVFTTEDSPLRKMVEIARDLEKHVTKIYGRTEMHVLMDLVAHSVLGFEFGGVMERRGWLDALIVGDTRTGKSVAASELLRHYGAGELVSCESVSFAGIVGGLEQIGGKEWAVKWGAIPLNDRRLVVMDEISGLSHEQIAQMSSIRSSGEAQLTKIHSERTYARTRIIWMGNPRNAKMADYTYGVYAIKPLIGNNEDIARFDLAMSLSAGEVSPDSINTVRDYSEEQKFPSWLCHELLMWAWSRKPHQVMWMSGAQDLVFEAAKKLGTKFVESPPLIQVANVRVKIARVAVAMAARTFSTFDGETIFVDHRHVQDAVMFFEKLYSMVGFGYYEHSKELIEEEQQAKEMAEEARTYLYAHPGLSKFLRSGTSGLPFRSQDLQDMMNMSKEQASATITTLSNMRMVHKEEYGFRPNPILHDILREIKI